MGLVRVSGVGAGQWLGRGGGGTGRDISWSGISRGRGIERMGGEVGPDALDGALDPYALEIVGPDTDEALPETIGLYGLDVGYGCEIGSEGGGSRGGGRDGCGHS